MSSPTPSPDPAACPRCHRPIPAAAPLGACPHCLLAAGLPSAFGPVPAEGTPPPTPAELAPEFPSLEIIELLGRGGMGAVYKARQRDLDRLVALKILRPGLDADPGFAERFTREARALAQLNHPGIVTLFEFGHTSAGRYFILMEFVDGMNLRGLLDAGRLAPREALAIVPPLCDALQYAHDRGIVHRDIKPENILVDRLGRIKIADFGIAKLTATAATTPGVPATAPIGHSPLDIGHSAEGVGTPAYMAPEQRQNPAEVDHRADLYALGVVLYQMLTGELPAPGQLQPPSHRVQIDVRLDEIVLRALEKDPALRYAAASEFKTHLENVTSSTAPGPASAGSASSDPAPAASAARPSFRPWIVLLLLFAAYAGALLLTADQLPARVASHFNAEGHADGWMPRGRYLAFVCIIPGALVLMLALAGQILRWLPASLINLPHRDHWLAPGHKAATSALFSRWMAVPACLLLVLFAQLHLATVLANHKTPPQLSTGLLVGPIIGFVAALMLWLVGLVLRFAEPDASPAKIRRQTWALLVAGLLALVLPAAPLLPRAAAVFKPASTAQTAWNLDVVVTDHRAWPPRTFSHDQALNTAAFALAVLGSCDTRQPATPHDWRAAEASSHLRFAYPRAAEGKMPDVILVPLPLARDSALWTRKGEKITRHTTFSPVNAEALTGFLDALPLVVVLLADGMPRIDGAPVSTEALHDAIADHHRRSPTSGIEIRPTTSTSSTSLASVLKICKTIGLSRVKVAPAVAAIDRPPVEDALAWLQKMDRGDYAGSWHESGASFKASLSQPDWVKALLTVRAPLGQIQERRLDTSRTASELPGVPDGDHLVMTFATRFTHKAAAVETLIFSRQADGSWRATGYFIR